MREDDEISFKKKQKFYEVKCHPCNLIFNTKLRLSSHVRWDHKIKAVDFVNTREKTGSMSASEGEEPDRMVTCRQCGHTLKNKRSLDQHIYYYHKGDK